MSQMTKPYDLIVVGGGSAGLTAAEAATVLDVRVALVEKEHTGGECTWYGCIPSKTLIAAARKVHEARNGQAMGIHVGAVHVDFPALMQRIQQTIHSIYHEESEDALRERGIDVYTATARFSDPHTLQLDTGETLRGKYILLATGANNNLSAGFADVPYLTNRNLFELQALPEHLLIVGGGPIGTEIAQAFNRLGSKVTLISNKARLLPRDDDEAAQFIMDVLRKEGVQLELGTPAKSASGTVGDLCVELEGGRRINGTHLLLAIGKRPDIRNLNPDAAGIQHTDGVPTINKYLRTSQKHIFIAGDAAGGPQFTHQATSQATNALLSMLLPVPVKGIKPFGWWATFTDPEVAHAGLTEAAARAKHRDVQITRLPLSRADRAMTEGAAAGFVKLVHRKNGKLLGATLVGHNAGEMLNEWVAILSKKGYVRDAALTPKVYPTLGTTNAVLATEQLRQQMASGHWLGRLVKAVAHLKL